VTDPTPAPTRPTFVVTGCPRSGTLFTAEALSRLGHRCGHEQVFNPFVTDRFSFGSAQGDVSWLAAPFLDRLPEGSVVLHQLRNPLAVITSLLGQRFLQTKPHPLMLLRYRLQYHRVRLARPITNPLFIRFADRHCPGIFSFDDEPTRCAFFWVAWTERVTRAASIPHVAYERFRIEDLDGPALLDICHRLGGGQSLGEVERVRSELGTETHRARRVDPVALDQITDRSVRSRLVEMAAELGYDLTG
jgi:hypothetical protein